MTIPYDAKAHFQAQLQFLANALHTGQSPFWAPNVFGGSPQIADPQSLIFSPAFLIAYFNPQPSVTTVDWYALGLLGIAGLAIIAMFRDQGWHPIGALIAGLAYAFGGSAAWRIQHIGQIRSYAMLAVALWLLTRALDRKSTSWAVAAGLAAAMMIVGPDQVALLGGYVLAALVAAHVLDSSSPLDSLRQVARPLAAAGVTGLAVVAVPLILTYLFIEQSNRPEIALAEAVRGSLHPASLLTAVVGDLYGALDPKVDYWGPYSVAWSPDELTLSQNMSQVYAGALPLVLLIGAGLARGLLWSREIRFYSVALLVMSLYALGHHTPFYGIVYTALPGVSMFRRPADATFLIGGLVAIIAGYLAHRTLCVGRSVCPTRRRWTAKVAGLALLIAVSLAIAIARDRLGDAIKPVETAVLLFGASLAMVWAWERFGRERGLICLAATTALMVVDLRLNNGPNESTALSAARYEFMNPDCKNDTIRLLKAKLAQPEGSPRRDRVELVGLGFSWPNIGLIHGFDHVLGYNPLRMDVVERAVGARDSIAGWEQRTFTPLFPSYRSLLADMLGLRYIATPVPIETIDKRLQPGELKQIARTSDGYIYENTRAMPRVMLVRDWRQASFAELIETGQWPQFDPATTVLLEDEPAGSSEPSSAAAAGHVSLAHYENTVIEIDVTSATGGFVVVNNAWHPWWRATVDGQATDYLKANVMFAAVQVPAGMHRVRLEFEPIAGAFSEIIGSTPITQVSSRPKHRMRRPKA